MSSSKSSRKTRLKDQKKTNLFCNVVARINECNICGDKAYYSTSIPQRRHNTLPNMELFRCGHGMCEHCLTKLLVNNEFKCPWCGKESVYILQSFGSPKTRGTINTLSEYQYEWRNYLGRAMKSSHPFAKLHRQIMEKYNLLIKDKLIRKIKNDKLAIKEKIKKERLLSKQKAVCKICGRNKFTSEKQLKLHMLKKH